MGMLNALFGCSHKNLSFPITLRSGNRSSTGAARTPYVVCLDCGQEFPYDWNQMRVVRREHRSTASAAAALAPRRAA